MFEKYSAESPTRMYPLTLQFSFSSPAHVIATFFGCGVLHPAPGTWGTLAGWIVYLTLESFFSPVVWIAITLACFFLGSWASEKSGQDLGIHDHGGFVIDEVVAIWMVLLFIPASLPAQIAGFLGFRFFDIIKIFPAYYFDTDDHWQNGLGVMLDDIVAGIYTIFFVFLLF